MNLATVQLCDHLVCSVLFLRLGISTARVHQILVAV